MTLDDLELDGTIVFKYLNYHLRLYTT